MANFQKKTQRNVEFAKGGDTPMFGKGDRTVTDNPAQEKNPGSTDQQDDEGGNDKFAKGGSGKMFGYAGAQPAQAGKTSAR